MILQCLIADDEPIAHAVLESHIAKLKSLVIAGNCYNAFEVVDFLNNHQVDILLLDINMPEFTGLQMLSTLEKKPYVILTTAYTEHALEAFEHGVADYLLKPIRFERFLKAVNRIMELKKEQTDPVATAQPGRTAAKTIVSLKDGTTTHQVDTADILYAEAFGNFVKVFTTKQKIIAAITMKMLGEQLPSADFIRVHKSYIVNYGAISKITGNVLYIQKTEIPIGQMYKLDLERRRNQ
jgi:two-component system, LytTR family, response regulator